MADPEAKRMLLMMLEALQHVEPYSWSDTIARTIAEHNGPDACLLLIQSLERMLAEHGEGLTPEVRARRQLGAALEALKKHGSDRFLWLEEVAQAVAELGGGDAVDHLHMKLDDALGGTGQDQSRSGDPAEN